MLRLCQRLRALELAFAVVVVLNGGRAVVTAQPLEAAKPELPPSDELTPDIPVADDAAAPILPRVLGDLPTVDPQATSETTGTDEGSIVDTSTLTEVTSFEDLEAHIFSYSAASASAPADLASTVSRAVADAAPKPHELCTSSIFPYLCGDPKAPESKRCCYNGIADKCETTKDPRTGEVTGTCTAYCNLRYMYPCGDTCCEYNKECLKGGPTNGFCSDPCFLAGALCGHGKGSRCCKSWQTCMETGDPKKPYACNDSPKTSCKDAKPPSTKCGPGCCILRVEVCNSTVVKATGKIRYACCPQGTVLEENPDKPGDYLCTGKSGPKCGKVGGQEYRCPTGFKCCSTTLSGTRPLCCPDDTKCDLKNRKCIPTKDPDSTKDTSEAPDETLQDLLGIE